MIKKSLQVKKMLFIKQKSVRKGLTEPILLVRYEIVIRIGAGQLLRLAQYHSHFRDPVEWSNYGQTLITQIRYEMTMKIKNKKTLN